MHKLLKIFSINLLVGYFFESFMNLFWQYVHLYYFLGAPVGIVFVWAILLTAGYLVVEGYEEKTKILG